MSEVIKGLLKPGDTFVDLGSNEGYFAVMAGRLVGEQGKVLAIEPQNRLLAVIQKNAEINGLKNIKLKPFGIGSSRGTLTLQLYPSTNTGASSFAPGFNFKVSAGWIRKRIYGTQQAEIITLDDLREDMGNHVRLIKIDIEGFELEALKGATVCLENGVFEHLLIETHAEALHAMGQSVDQIDQLLASKGYQKKVIASNLNLYSRS
jgi:FkbM family methyltransferase